MAKLQVCGWCGKLIYNHSCDGLEDCLTKLSAEEIEGREFVPKPCEPLLNLLEPPPKKQSWFNYLRGKW